MIENNCDCKPNNAKLVQDVKNKMPDVSEILDLSDFFKVLGDSTRLQLLMALQQNELCVSDLANVLNMTKSAVSHQLKALRMSKLVKQKKGGRCVYYSLDDDHVSAILKISFEHINEK